VPGCDEVNSFSQADCLRKLIGQTEMSVHDTSLSLTASFGVTAALPGHIWMSESLIRKADEALYMAKKSGCNRVEFLPCKAETIGGRPSHRKPPPCRITSQ
jgi:diguanylate cyclase (GGDEF)-like protein